MLLQGCISFTIPEKPKWCSIELVKCNNQLFIDQFSCEYLFQKLLSILCSIEVFMMSTQSNKSCMEYVVMIMNSIWFLFKVS